MNHLTADDLINAYLRRSLPEAVAAGDAFLRFLRDYLDSHATGQLEEALRLVDSLDPGVLAAAPERARQFLTADLNLIHAKVGRKPDLELRELADPVANLVLQYAYFTHLFWANHREVVRCLATILRFAIRHWRLDFALMALFLVAHLRTIANKRIFSFHAARALYRICYYLRRRDVVMSPFAHDIVVATFPYTCYVRAAFRDMRRALTDSRPYLGSDPYYNLLYRITELYHAAYSGNVVDTERTVAVFQALQEQGKLLRYRPVTTLMDILPFCIRGYEHVVKERFRAFMATFDPAEHDTLINSQVYRVAAIVHTALGEFELASSAIEEAVRYRKLAAFNSWTHVDEKIRQVITGKGEVEEIFGPLGTASADRSAYLKSGYVISRLVDQLAHSVGALEEQAARAADVIARHLGVDFVIGAAPSQTGVAWMLPVALFERSVYFSSADPAKQGHTRQLLEILLPSVRSIEATSKRFKEAQDSLKEREKLAAIAGTAQMLAHDVRKPFAQVESLIRKIHTADASTVKALCEQHLPLVERSLHTVNSMIEDIMEIGRTADSPDAARSERAKVAGRSQVEQSVSDFAMIVSEVVQGSLGEGESAPRGVEVDTVLGHQKAFAVDAVKLTRVLANLVDNAVQAIAATGGKIWIETKDLQRADGAWIHVTVRNSNSHIPASELPRLFDAFYTRNKPGGTGLGLAIVKTIVAAYGGEITCESDAALGTRFHFTLPAWEQAGSRHVVVVDDCPFIRSQWADLTSLGRVVTFASPSEFWAACLADASIIRESMSIVTDHYFDNDPEKTGLDFAVEMRAAGYAGPLYISSNASLDQVAISGVKALMIAKDPEAAAAAIGG